MCLRRADAASGCGRPQGSPVTLSEIIAAMVEVECPSLSPALFIRHSVKMFFVSLLMARPGHYVSSPFTVFAFSFFSFCGALNSRRCVLLLCVTHSVVQSLLGRGGGLIATDQIA